LNTVNEQGFVTSCSGLALN